MMRIDDWDIPIAIRDVYHREYTSWRDFLSSGKPKKLTRHEWVLVAERIAAEHDGLLPQVNRLRRMGYTGLAQIMNLHPDLFSHIEREAKFYKQAEEWVPIAEKLTAEHEGVLPNRKWLQRNGHTGLDHAMYNNPHLFAHLEQQRPRLTPGEWLPIAQRLAEEHGGVLPCSIWLNANGYSGLYFSFKKHPEVFAGIRVDRKKPFAKSLDEHVAEAERLAAQNGGLLPNVRRLISSGHISLNSARRKNPHRFAHLTQARKTQPGKTLTEHVADAERLAAANGGVLPTFNQLRELAGHRLVTALCTHRHQFAHIPGVRPRTGGPAALERSDEG